MIVLYYGVISDANLLIKKFVASCLSYTLLSKPPISPVPGTVGIVRNEIEENYR